MNETLLALRAITSEFLRSRLNWITGIMMVIFCALTLLTVFLAIKFSELWWLGFAVIFPLGLIVGTVLFVLHYANKRFAPRRLSASERKQVKDLVSKSSALIDRAGTPLPLAVFLVAKDVVLGRESRLLREVIDNSSSLKDDFTTLKNTFRNR